MRHGRIQVALHLPFHHQVSLTPIRSISVLINATAYTLPLGEAGETLTFPAGSVPDGTTVSVDRRVDHIFSLSLLSLELSDTTIFQP